MNKIENLISLRVKLPSKQIQLTSSLPNVMIMNDIAYAVAYGFMELNVGIMLEMTMSWKG